MREQARRVSEENTLGGGNSTWEGPEVAAWLPCAKLGREASVTESEGRRKK